MGSMYISRIEMEANIFCRTSIRVRIGTQYEVCTKLWYDSALYNVGAGQRTGNNIRRWNTIPLMTINPISSQKSTNRLTSQNWMDNHQEQYLECYSPPFLSVMRQKTSSVWRSVSICPKPNANTIINLLSIRLHTPLPPSHPS